MNVGDKRHSLANAANRVAVTVAICLAKWTEFGPEDSPYRHFHGSWQSSPHTALPTAVRGPCTRSVALSACRSNHICCPPTGTVCSRHSSRAGSVPYN